MLTEKDRPGIERAIKRLVKASVAHSWIGSKHPEDYLAIKTELDLAEKNMVRILDKLTDHK